MCLEDIRLQRQTYTYENTISVGTSPIELVPAVPNRTAIIITAPQGGSSGSNTPINQSANAVSTATSGVKLSYVVPANQTALLTEMVLFFASGSAGMRPELIINGNFVAFQGQTTANLNILPNILLNAGDTVQWNCTSASAGSVDLLIALQQSGGSSSSAISLSTNPSVSFGQGIVLSGGSDPLTLDLQHYGDIVRKRWYVVGSTSNMTISTISTILDIQ